MYLSVLYEFSLVFKDFVLPSVPSISSYFINEKSLWNKARQRKSLLSSIHDFRDRWRLLLEEISSCI
jgi:hypothetical protein